MNALFAKPAAWHEARRQGLGGSDARIYMNGSPEERIRLWQEKRGEVEPENLDWVLPVQMGNATEALNLAWLSYSLGVEFVPGYEQIVHPKYSFMRCNPDGLRPNGEAMGQCKHVNAWSKLPEVVEKYSAQCQHEMFVTGIPICYLSVFIGTTTHEVVKIEADTFYQDLLLERAKAFWACVESGELPDEVAPVAANVPLSERKPYDMTGNNEWASWADAWLVNAKAAKIFKGAEKELRLLVPADASEVKGHGVIAKVSKDGKIGLKEAK